MKASILLLALIALSVEAQTIYRCPQANGVVLYTHTPCGTVVRIDKGMPKADQIEAAERLQDQLAERRHREAVAAAQRAKVADEERKAFLRREEMKAFAESLPAPQVNITNQVFTPPPVEINVYRR